MTSATEDALELVPTTPIADAARASARGRWSARLAPWARSAGARSGREGGDAPGRVASLHVVTGPHAERVARGVLELVARALADGERVLVVDGSPRQALHARLECAPTPGLADATGETPPPPGLIVPTACPGCALIPYGDPKRSVRWSRFAAALGAEWPHAAQVIIGLAHDAPRAAGRALAAIAHSGWWAAPDVACRVARGFSNRLRIPLFDIELDPMFEPSLAGVRRRVRALAGARGPMIEPALDARILAPEPFLIGPAHGLVAHAPGAARPESSQAPHAGVEGSTAGASATPPGQVTRRREALAAPAREPGAVLDGDPRVRERLRFLMWMRRMSVEAGSIPAIR